MSVSAEGQPLVGIIMGSRSDWETMRHAADVLAALEVPHETRVVSAHRTPDRLYGYAGEALGRGLRVIIAGAGGAAHLPGMCAAMTRLPVLGVPVQSAALNGIDSLLSIVQMPAGVPVGTLAIGRAGAVNAGLMAAAILAGTDKTMAHFEQVLDSNLFVRTHRSYIVNVQQITRIDPYEKESYVAILKNGKQVPVSKTGYGRLREVLGL